MKCKLCQENFDTIYRIPRNLVCGHTFCEQCLKIYSKNEEINCPKCTKISSAHNLPICYAIYEMIEFDNNHKKNDVCFYHYLEKTQFYCKDDNIYVCLLCYLNDHRDHRVVSIKENNFVEETKKEFDNKMRVLKEKLENYEKQIELNFLLQKENLSRTLNKVENKQQIIELYSYKINDLLKNISKKLF